MADIITHLHVFFCEIENIKMSNILMNLSI